MLAVLLALVVSLLVHGQIVGAIRAIEEASIELRSGDLTRRVHVASNDEMARTVRAFSELVDGFQTAVKKVGQVSTVVVASAEQLYGASGRVRSANWRSARRWLPTPSTRCPAIWVGSRRRWSGRCRRAPRPSTTAIA